MKATIRRESAANRGSAGIGVLNGERGPYGRQQAGGQWPTENEPNCSGHSEPDVAISFWTASTSASGTSTNAAIVVRGCVLSTTRSTRSAPPRGAHHQGCPAVRRSLAAICDLSYHRRAGAL